MTHPQKLKYRGVPDDVSRVAANICWDFIEELDALSTEIEEIGKVVANIRYSADPAEWKRRLQEGEERLGDLPVVLARLSGRVQLMGEHLPVPNNPENHPSNWIGGREFDPEFDIGCDGGCGATGEKEAAGSWFLDPETQLIYCKKCAIKRELIQPDGTQL